MLAEIHDFILRYWPEMVLGLLLVIAYQLAALATLYKGASIIKARWLDVDRRSLEQIRDNTTTLDQNVQQMGDYVENISKIMNLVERYSIPDRDARHEIDQARLEHVPSRLWRDDPAKAKTEPPK